MGMKIGVDIDDVVAQFMPGFVDWLGGHTGFDLPVESVTDYSLEKALAVTRAEARGYLQGFEREVGLQALKPVLGAKKAIQALQNEGHEIYFLSARDGRHVDRTHKWLEENGFPPERAIFTKRKAEFADKLGLDVVVEDDPSVILGVMTRYRPAILYDQPWNRDFDEPNSPPMGQLYKAKNWTDVNRHIRSINRENGGV